MKKVVIIINSSPITTAMISRVLLTCDRENLVVLTVRCDEVIFVDTALTFHSKDESILTHHAKVAIIFQCIFEKFGKNIEIEAFTPYGGWLFMEVLYSLSLTKKINYIEEGLGTYSGVIDFINKNHVNLNYFKKTIYSEEEKPSIKGKIVFSLSSCFSKPLLLVSKFLWKLDYLNYSVFIFKLYRRSQENCSYLGDLLSKKTGIFYTTLPLYGFENNHVLGLEILQPVQQEKKILILLPPSQHIQNSSCQIFFDKINYILSNVSGVSFYYRSHPADLNQRLTSSFNKYFGNKVISIDHIVIKNETVIWSYENGYTGLICYQSAAMFYAIQLGRINNQILSLDLSREVSNAESPSLFIAKQLNTAIYGNTTESTEFFLNRYKETYN